MLLGHALGLDRAALLVRANEPVAAADYRTYGDYVGRRAAGEPLQYITGRQEFYGLDFLVTPAVLIPRPETEFLVEQVLKLAPAEGLIADIGTGSGCIAVTVAKHRQGARVFATDISGAALEVARENARRHGVAVEFLAGDLLAPLAGRGLEGAFDVLASNPPYVPATNPELLQREVRDWEPPVALFSGAEGLDLYRRLLDEGRVYVRPGGYLICEIGYSQLEAIRRMVAPPDWELVEVTEDLQGIPRTLIIRRTADPG